MQTEKKARLKSLVKTLLKIALSLLALYWVSRQIDLGQVGDAWQRTQVWWTLPALALYIGSKVLSSYRLNIYFRAIGLALSEAINLRLYWLGMFYNLFLPGGIGGDGYKIWWLNHHYKLEARKGFQAVLLDRLSGMAALGFLAAVLACLIPDFPIAAPWILLASVAGVALYGFAMRRIFPLFASCILPTNLLGLLVQGVQVICMACLLYAVGVKSQYTAYLFLFLVSSAVAVLPLSVGGLGARELVFLYGAQWLGLDPGVSVLVSLWFYLLSLISSLPGVLYVLRPSRLLAPVAAG